MFPPETDANLISSPRIARMARTRAHSPFHNRRYCQATNAQTRVESGHMIALVIQTQLIA